MLQTIFVLLFIVYSNGSWDYSDEDIVGWDKVDYKTRKEAEVALKKQEDQTKALEKSTKERIRRLRDDNKKFSTNTKQKRANRNERRKLTRKLKESKIKLLNYQELVKKF